MDTRKRLEELRTILRSETMSYDELHEPQDLGERGLIDPGDVELLEAAGVPEQRGGAPDTRKLALHIDGDSGVKSRIELEDFGVTHFIDGDTDMVAELVRRWNAYPKLVAELERLNNALQNVAFAPTKGAYKSTQEGVKEAVLEQVRSINTLLTAINPA